jgi:hypothetical protein
MSLNAQAAVIAHLTAENKRLKDENDLLAAHAVIDADRIQLLLAAQPVLRVSPRMGAV